MQIAIALTAEELEAQTRGQVIVTLPVGTEGTSGFSQVQLSGAAS